MKWRTSFQVAATYVGSVMGAGFASGQEIQQFFTRFDIWGLFGILVSTVMFSLLGWRMLVLQQRWNVSSYSEFFACLLGPVWGKRADVLVSALLFVGMLAMLTGSGALFHEYFGLPTWVGALFTSVLIAIALWFRGEGVLWINTVLIPLKFTFCFGIAIAAIGWATTGDGEGLIVNYNPLVQHWLSSSILYVSFNLTLAMVVFASLGKEVQGEGARLGAILGGVALGLFALIIGSALLRFPDVLGMEIPMVAIAGKLGSWTSFLYLFVLWLAMITASISNGFSLVCRMVNTGKISYEKAALLLLIAVCALTGVKFSHIVQFAYPIFGYLGLFFLPALFVSWRRGSH